MVINGVISRVTIHIKGLITPLIEPFKGTLKGTIKGTPEPPPITTNEPPSVESFLRLWRCKEVSEFRILGF